MNKPSKAIGQAGGSGSGHWAGSYKKDIYEDGPASFFQMDCLSVPTTEKRSLTLLTVAFIFDFSKPSSPNSGTKRNTSFCLARAAVATLIAATF